MPPSDEPIFGLGLDQNGDVQMVLPLSGAEEAGLRRGQKVKEYSVSGMSGPWVGVDAWPKGTKNAKAVWLRMEGGKVRKVERKAWKRPGMIDRGSRLQVFWFDDETVAAFKAAGANPRRSPVRELDLRGSPGGYTDSATAFLGLFLGPGKELGSYEYRDSLGRKRHRPWLTNPDARQVLDPKEWRILVDDRTASSGELVAECLARWGAEVVGGPTLGKHEVIEMHNAQDGWIVCTVGRFLLEKGWR
jgi:C-terminal processing protease CtpA/Prc